MISVYPRTALLWYGPIVRTFLLCCCLAVPVAACGSSGSSPSGQRGAPKARAGAPTPLAAQEVASKDVEGWPLIVESGTILCDERGAIFFETGGKRYGLNGLGKSASQPINPIWAYDPKNEGMMLSLSPLLEIGQKLCKSIGSAVGGN